MRSSNSSGKSLGLEAGRASRIASSESAVTTTAPVTATAVARSRPRRPRARMSRTPSPMVKGMTDRPTARARREAGRDEVPARIASRTVQRVLRRVASKAPAKSTGSTTQLATRMCQGFAAIVGEPRRVSALGAARRGGRTAPSANPRSAATSPSAVDSSAKAIPIWRGVKPTAFSLPRVSVSSGFLPQRKSAFDQFEPIQIGLQMQDRPLDQELRRVSLPIRF
jgi:hypothetical protein